MDDARIGSAFRALRIRKGWSQGVVADRAGVARSTVSRLECGQLAAMPMATVRDVAHVLGVSLDIVPRWRGSDLDRLLSAAHHALHEHVSKLFRGFPGWIVVPEVSYSVYGERGVIDLIGWHDASRSLLIVELKTWLVDPAELVGSMDRRVRLGTVIGRERGWSPRCVSAWVVLTDTRTNRRRVEHAPMLRAAFPVGGREVRAWLASPAARISALSFVSDDRAVTTRRIATRAQDGTRPPSRTTTRATTRR